MVTNKLTNKYYNVNEVFFSLDGEVNPWYQGKLSFFIRLQNCNLQCPYCDTKQSWKKEENLMSNGEILFVFDKNNSVPKITITGGEPLLQDLEPLITPFLKMGKKISIETNGTVSPMKLESWIFHPDVSFIVDIKLPSSGVIENQIHWEFLGLLSNLKNTWFKAVVFNLIDFLNLKEYVFYHPDIQTQLAISPVLGVEGALTIKELYDLMLQSFPTAVLNVQLHKFIDFK